MIVISGVLLLVAVVFLVIGLFGPLVWVYASIGVSVASFASCSSACASVAGTVPDAGRRAPRAALPPASATVGAAGCR